LLSLIQVGEQRSVFLLQFFLFAHTVSITWGASFVTIIILQALTVDLGDCTITVRWKKASETTALQALRKAAKQIQERERPDQAA
jgi:hypothetical protein